jgi:hypothetical protein
MANGCYGKYDVTKYSRVITDDKYPISVINVDREHDVKKYIHPTQKPVALIEYLIKTYTNRGGGLSSIIVWVQAQQPSLAFALIETTSALSLTRAISIRHRSA